MNRIWGLIILALAASSTRADLQFAEKTVKAGEVHTGQPLRQRFTFTNRGLAVVTIDRLSAACGCMTPRLDRKSYPPGESGSFVLEVNTLTQPAGPNRWRVQVQYTDGGQSKLQ